MMKNVMNKVFCLILSLMMCFALVIPVIAETAFKNGDTIPSGNYDGIIIPNGATVSIKSNVILESDSSLCLGDRCKVNIKKNGLLSGENIRIREQNWESCKFKLNKNGGINLSFASTEDADTFVSILKKSKIKYSRDGNTITAGKINISTGSVISEGNITILLSILIAVILAVVVIFVVQKITIR